MVFCPLENSFISVSEMSRTVAFGRDILGAPDVDIEVKVPADKMKYCVQSYLCQDLLACLSSSEVQEMLDELASDPDDKHVPPSVR